MRFLLDENVDARVGGVIREAGHESWTVPSAGMASVDDETVAVYGHNRGAVVVTHDEEFSEWRGARIWGRHLWLRCTEPRARDLVGRHLEDIVTVFERYQDVFAEVSPDGCTFSFAWS